MKSFRTLLLAGLPVLVVGSLMIIDKSSPKDDLQQHRAKTQMVQDTMFERARPVNSIDKHTGESVTRSQEDRSDSGEMSRPNRLQPVKISESLQQATDWFRKPIKRFDSPKAQHAFHLKQKAILDSDQWIDPQNGTTVRSILVRDDSSRFKSFIIDEYFDGPQSERVKNQYVRVANHLLVRFQNDPNQKDLQAFLETFQLRLQKPMAMDRTYLLSVPEVVSLAENRKLFASIAADSRVDFVEGNSLTYPSRLPNDPLFNTLWGLQNNGVDPFEVQDFQADIDIDAELAWEEMVDCTSTIVAVLDTGVTPNHPDLMDNVLANQGRDFTSNDQTDFIDRQGHGTHVSGTIGAVGNNNEGIAGVCWNAAIIPVKVLGDEGFGTLDFMLNGLMYTASTQAKVLNLSLGGAPPTQAEQDAIAANTSAGKLLVIAAGNENNNNDANPAFPASYPDPRIISVAALHGGGDLAEFSNYGTTTVDIAAPGQNIVSTYPMGLGQNPNVPYEILSGTSMASPHVAGAVALFWSYAPDLTADQVKQEVLSSAITKPFSKPVAESRMMDLKAMLDTVKAKASFQLAEGGIRVSNSPKYTFDLDLTETYADVAKIEVLLEDKDTGEDKVIGSAVTNDGKVSVELPMGYSNLVLSLRVTDSAGRVYLSENVDVEVDLEKLLNFANVDLGSLEGSLPCSLSKENDAGDVVKLHEFSVTSERACQKLCGIIGPMTYSSLGKVHCSTDSQPVYTAQRSQ